MPGQQTPKIARRVPDLFPRERVGSEIETSFPTFFDTPSKMNNRFRKEGRGGGGGPKRNFGGHTFDIPFTV